MDFARERAGIAPNTPVRMVILPERPTLFETLFRRRNDDVVEARVLGEGAAAVLEWAARLNDAGPLARVPFDLRVR